MTDYSHPLPVTDVQLASPANLGELLPPYSQVEDWAGTASARPFMKFVQTWLSPGLDGSSEMKLKPGIDGNTLLRHLKTVAGSTEPEHEHKMAAMAWLLSQWCDEVKAVPKIEQV